MISLYVVLQVKNSSKAAAELIALSQLINQVCLTNDPQQMKLRLCTTCMLQKGSAQLSVVHECVAESVAVHCNACMLGNRMHGVLDEALTASPVSELLSSPCQIAFTPPLSNRSYPAPVNPLLPLPLSNRSYPSPTKSPRTSLPGELTLAPHTPTPDWRMFSHPLSTILCCPMSIPYFLD